MAVTAPRAWQVVLERIENDLRDGRLSPGDRLTPERELATQLGVGRSSVREAVRVLEVLGVVRTATGSGPTAGAMIVTTPRGGLAAFLRLQVAANGFPLADVVRTRIVLECDVAERLAQTDADLSGVHEMLAAMDADDLSPAEFLALDARFHQALAEVSGNAVVSAMMAGLRSSIEEYTSAGAAGLDAWPRIVERLRREHRHIVDAVSRGEPDEAREAVRAHITDYYTDVSEARRADTESSTSPTP
ncbi:MULTISPECIES: FadR/GntR family transcriptional regulator [Microbacterium]|uniref:FadR/GntR family transcriptional regulator n=1 Tax=Microbacterium TaxID=33882 RepID=UPI002784AF12|nr:MULTISPECIES: FCD domain-containing protein [Microbacterium]MDQ1084754.1 GntR family transcriptional repressor for pyruvate dehydrogenase complex [Microbacterium sp. SORGH_AS_0344]MDQ1169967.1 GntR family transcriptional repressor for pyruvate dehydrogenase complex [Microbacterium proteolyticum]